MGKVKDGASASSSAKGAKSGGGSASRGSRIAPFFANLLKTEVYKPNHGFWARVLTGAGLGVTVGIGLWQFFDVLSSIATLTRYSVITALTLAFGWFIYRLLQFPAFADFLTATESEMRRVSWTSKEDLKRATMVVLISVVVVSVFLFGVDLVWSRLLQILGVLRFTDASGGLGSNA